MRLVDSDSLPAPSSADFQRASDRSLISLLGIALNPVGGGRTAAPPPEIVPEAFPFYLQGLGYLSRSYDRANIAAAQSLFTQAKTEDPNFASAWAGLCAALWEEYVWFDDPAIAREATESCNTAAELGDELPSVLVSLAATYFQTGQHRSGISALERTLEIDPTNTEAYRWLGRTYEDLGRSVEAEAAFRRAIELRPDVWVNYEDLGIMLASSGALEEAGALFERVRQLAPDNHLADIYLAFTRLEQDLVEEAEDLYRLSILKQPDAIAYRNLGHLFFRERQYAQAITELQQGLELDANDWWIWRWLGHAHHWNGDAAESEAAWRRVIEITSPLLEVNERNIDVLGGLAEAHIALGEIEMGRHYLDRLTALPSKWNYVTYYTGRIFEMIGNRETALTYVERALENHYDPITVERDPWLEDLRADPRYQAIRESLNAS